MRKNIGLSAEIGTMTALNPSAQLRYLLQWFGEWSELQKSDFLVILAENYAHKAYVNGIVNSISNMNYNDKPMSLFECRVSYSNNTVMLKLAPFHCCFQMKLFKEWFTQWNIEMKENFLTKISEIDPIFFAKLNAEIEEKAGADINNVEQENHIEDHQ